MHGAEGCGGSMACRGSHAARRASGRSTLRRHLDPADVAGAAGAAGVLCSHRRTPMPTTGGTGPGMAGINGWRHE